MDDKNKKKNPFIEAIKLFLDKRVVVTVFTPTETEEIEGTCIGIDYIQRSVILKTDDKMMVIPRFLHMSREKINEQ